MQIWAAAASASARNPPPALVLHLDSPLLNERELAAPCGSGLLPPSACRPSVSVGHRPGGLESGGATALRRLETAVQGRGGQILVLSDRSNADRCAQGRPETRSDSHHTYNSAVPCGWSGSTNTSCRLGCAAGLPGGRHRPVLEHPTMPCLIGFGASRRPARLTMVNHRLARHPKPVAEWTRQAATPRMPPPPWPTCARPGGRLCARSSPRSASRCWPAYHAPQVFEAIGIGRRSDSAGLKAPQPVAGLSLADLAAKPWPSHAKATGAETAAVEFNWAFRQYRTGGEFPSPQPGDGPGPACRP